MKTSILTCSSNLSVYLNALHQPARLQSTQWVIQLKTKKDIIAARYPNSSVMFTVLKTEYATCNRNRLIALPASHLFQ